MKVRQHKHAIYARMFPGLLWGTLVQAFDTPSSWIHHKDPVLAELAEQLIREHSSMLGRIETGQIKKVIEVVLPGGHNDTDALEVLNAAAELDSAKTEYVCVRVKDGVVVETFDLFEDADQLVTKHVRQKKARLQILNSLTGEIVQSA